MGNQTYLLEHSEGVNTDGAHRYTRIMCLKCGRTFDVPRYCGNRFCEVCTKRKRAVVFEKITHIVRKVRLKAKESFRHVTLTVPSENSVDEMVRHLVESFKKLRNTRYWKSYVKGGAYVVHVKMGKMGWHCHIHAVLVTQFIPLMGLKAEWERCSGGTNLDVRRIQKTVGVKHLCAYMCKTNVKGAELRMAGRALKGMHLYNVIGNWHGKLKDFVGFKSQCPTCGGQKFASMNDIEHYREIGGQEAEEWARGLDKGPPGVYISEEPKQEGGVNGSYAFSHPLDYAGVCGRYNIPCGPVPFNRGESPGCGCATEHASAG